MKVGEPRKFPKSRTYRLRHTLEPLEQLAILPLNSSIMDISHDKKTPIQNQDIETALSRVNGTSAREVSTESATDTSPYPQGIRFWLITFA
jgi:hypothetical protein